MDIDPADLPFVVAALKFFKKNAKAKDALKALAGYDFDGTPGDELDDAEAVARARNKADALVEYLELDG